MGLDDRAPADRLADHAAIDTLADELIPALIAKLGASSLGEIEVREGDWKVRLRRPSDGVVPGSARRPGERSGRTPVAAPPSRSPLTPVGPGRAAAGQVDETDGQTVTPTATEDRPASVEAGVRGRDPFRAMATSPAVGFYQPRTGLAPGSRVRAGDPIGSIDVLGVPIEVTAPTDGIVGASLVEPGDAVEYGQELVWVELLSAAPTATEGGADPGAPGEP